MIGRLLLVLAFCCFTPTSPLLPIPPITEELRLPLKIEVRNKTFFVLHQKRVRRDETNWRGITEDGQIIKTCCLLRIEHDDCPANEAETLSHEIYHAILGTGHSDDVTELHDYISKLSPGLMAVYRDNPELLDYYKHALAYPCAKRQTW